MRGCRERHRAKSSLKQDTVLSDCINEGRSWSGITIATEVIGPERINGDKDYPLEVNRCFIMVIENVGFFLQDYPCGYTCSNDKNDDNKREDLFAGQT
jgi:hypothetical protein